MPRYPYYGYLVYFRQCCQFFYIQSATSSDFVSLAPRAANAFWLSVQIVVCSFNNVFLRQLVTRSSIAITSTRKAVASCTIEMCHYIWFWYLQIRAPVPYWLQAPSVNQSCRFFSLLGQFFLPLFPSWYFNPIFTEKVPQGYVVLYHTEFTVHFICFCPDQIVFYS